MVLIPHPIVVDASIAVKWVVPAENLARQARALLDGAAAAGDTLVGPPHLPGEVTNALYQRTRTRETIRQLATDVARAALVDFMALPLQIVGSPGLYEDAYSFARAQNLPGIYDSIYVVLARELGTELWTADQRLLSAVGRSAPWVRSIAHYPLTR